MKRKRERRKTVPALNLDSGCAVQENHVTEMENVNELLETAPTLPEEVKATISYEDMDDYDKVVETGIRREVRNPVKNMRTRLLEDAQGRKFYVWIEKDENADRRVDFYQQYRSGEFSAKLEIAMGDLITVAMDARQKITDEETQKDIRIFLKRFRKTYLNSFNGEAGEAVAPLDIIKMVEQEMRSIPIYNDDTAELEREAFWHQILENVSILSSQLTNDHRAYYAIDDDDLRYVANCVGMDRVRLLKKLRKYDLLYLTESSKGYQTNVRMRNMDGSTYTAWRYCIVRDEEAEKSQENPDVWDF